MKKNIVIVHYNTPLLTECLVRSINLFVKDAIIYIFDNSDKDPFTAHFDNVLVLDNTKGEIIDFDKWLEKYPNKTKTSATRNGYGSAKHCYSVQKCMELIKEDFVLLDSDILLKKDISEIFNSNYVFVGDTEYWKARSGIAKYTKERAIPYLCYINTKKCNEKGIKYFDDKRIYGLTQNGDNYDTGASFLEDIKKNKLSWKKIPLSSFIVHYKAGSWAEDAKEHDNYHQVSFSEWLDRNRNLWHKSEPFKGKKVVYTCITGDYDNLIEPRIVSKGFDYVCFTDNKDMKSDVWEIRPLPKETEELSQVKKQRYIKLNPHLVLNEYDLSVWVDGSVTVKGDLNKLLDKVITDNCSIYVPQHPARNCIYAESEAVISMRRDTTENVKPQMDRYKEEGFPKKFGLLQSNIMIRKHNSEDCIKFMEEWFSELKNGSHRDQLSFNYIQWKNQDIKVKYLDKKIYMSEWFSWNGIHKKKTFSIRREINATTNRTKNHKSIEELKKEFRAMMEERKSRHSRKVTTDKLSIYTV